MGIDKLLAILTSHWPFLAVALILGILGEVMKGLILGSDNKKVSESLFAYFYKKTLALHPIFAGALMGAVLSATIPDVVMTGGLVSSVLYFAVSGALSNTIYSLLKSLRPEITKTLRNKVASMSSAKSSESGSEEP